MQILAQSQAPTKLSYIHLAYLSAGLGNSISKGELYPMQAMLGAGLLAAVAYGAIRVKLRRNGKAVRTAISTGIFGFFVMVCALWFIQKLWAESRSNEQVIEHVIKTHQWWALREPAIAAGIESAALTNGEAAAMAANYYSSMGGHSVTGDPVLFIKTEIYGEKAAAKGIHSWAGVDPKKDWSGYEPIFKATLESGKLNPAEQTWVKQHLAELKLKTKLEQDGLNK